MLRSVDLDNETPFVAGEVSEERSDGGLSPEMRVLDWQASQVPPEFAFRVGHVATQFASAGNAWVEFLFLMCCHARPPPLPPPHHAKTRGGEGRQHRRAFLTLQGRALRTLNARLPSCV